MYLNLFEFLQGINIKIFLRRFELKYEIYSSQTQYCKYKNIIFGQHFVLWMVVLESQCNVTAPFISNGNYGLIWINSQECIVNHSDFVLFNLFKFYKAEMEFLLLLDIEENYKQKFYLIHKLIYSQYSRLYYLYCLKRQIQLKTEKIMNRDIKCNTNKQS